jgi:hypothetical protein
MGVRALAGMLAEPFQLVPNQLRYMSLQQVSTQYVCIKTTFKSGPIKCKQWVWYTYAQERVLAWIGRDDGAETASCLIRKIRTSFEEAMEGDRDLYLRDFIDAQDQDDLEFVVRMFREPLFSHVWIIQELGVGRDITFLYGDFEIDWIDLLFFVYCMVSSQDLY